MRLPSHSELVSRFGAKFVPDPNSGCWLWTAGGTFGGYGAFWMGYDRGLMPASRASWIIHRGAIPNGLFVLHRCDVRCCVNPNHLFLGTVADNSADMIAKGRENPWGRHVSTCKRGHQFTPENTRISRVGKRVCRTCKRDHTRANRHRWASEKAA